MGVFNGIVIGLGALVLGVPLAGSIGVISFVAAYIPYLGAWTAGAFTVLVALGDGGPSAALAMGVITLLANGALQQLIQPIAYGAALGIHPLAVLIVTIAGGALFGTIGLIVAAPLTSAVTKIARDLAVARPRKRTRPRPRHRRHRQPPHRPESAVSGDDVLLGLGLVLVLAVAAQLVARLTRLPAIVVLLPAGFIAGAVTDVVHPDKLLGDLFQPFVSIAVGVILFEAGLRLSFGSIAPSARRLVAQLVSVGVLVTWLGVGAAAALLIGRLDTRVALLIGAILVVSGPTVVLPLLAFVRPQREVRSLLTWEGVLVDPVGALLGVLVFHAAVTGESWHPGEMLRASAPDCGRGRRRRRAAAAPRRDPATAPRQAVPVTLATVVGALVAADLLRDDAGFVATTAMGMALANQRAIDVSLMLEFQQTLVQLLVGVLFVLIAASVSPAEVEAVLPEALALVAVMVLVVRPAAVALATWRSALPLRERAFVAWMAPRGIVAGASASAFGLQLEQKGIQARTPSSPSSSWRSLRRWCSTG